MSNLKFSTKNPNNLLIIVSCSDHQKQLIYSKIKKLGVGTYQCTDCGLTKSSNGLTALKNHVESKHLAGMVEYPCAKCGKVLLTANQYNVHMSIHRNEEKKTRAYYQ